MPSPNESALVFVPNFVITDPQEDCTVDGTCPAALNMGHRVQELEHHIGLFGEGAGQEIW